MSHLYILFPDERTPLQVDDVLVWGRWFEENNRLVKQDTKDDVLVSTVFLGIDHSFIGDGPPVLWETLVFGGEHDGEMSRYTSYEEALEGHRLMCEVVFAGELGG